MGMRIYVLHVYSLTMNETSLREPAFLVLTALAAEPQHGYAIIEDVGRISANRVRLHTGSLYAVLDRLREAGLIEVEREEVVSSRLRRYYRLTGAGIERLAVETEQMRQNATTAANRLRVLRQKPAGGLA
jgi:DNA-binding PadR family transcriptional regulator